MRRSIVQRILEMHSKQWKILRKATSKQGARSGEQPIGINILSKYLKSMCTEAKINMDGRRFTNHSGKVTCATRLFQTGTFDEQTIMSRTGHRSTAVRSYKRPSSSKGKSRVRCPTTTERRVGRTRR